MKILLVTMEYPPFRGGVGNYYYNLIQYSVYIDFTVLTNNQTQNSNSKLKIVNQSLFYKYFWPRWLKLFFIVRKLIKQEKYDLIWSGQILPVGTVCYLINKFYNIPYFVSTHGMDIMLPQKSARKKKLMTKVLQAAKFITANSRFTQKQLVKLGIDANKIEVIYPCANISSKSQTSSFSEDQSNKIQVIKDKYGLNDKKILLTVGRLVKRKGQDMIIEAVNQLKNQYPDLMYLIVGDGPERENFQLSIANFQLQDQVIIINDVGDDDLPLYYQLADIFIMPSRDIEGDAEGFGIVYLEAASFGLAVIAGKSGGTGEAVVDGKTGILVNPENVEEIKSAVVNLLENEPYRRQLGRNGKIRGEKEFNWIDQALILRNKIKSSFMK